MVLVVKLPKFTNYESMSTVEDWMDHLAYLGFTPLQQRRGYPLVGDLFSHKSGRRVTFRDFFEDDIEDPFFEFNILNSDDWSFFRSFNHITDGFYARLTF